MNEQLEARLKKQCYTSEGPYLRPFFPNPNWRRASVFIVGLNPISPLRDEFPSFDDYWNSLVSFPDEYERACVTRYKRSDVERSRTSRRISDFCKLLHPVDVLVTNVIFYPVTNPKLIPAPYRREPASERAIAHLIQLCKPKVLIFHGREARKFAGAYFKTNLDPYLPPKKQEYKVSIAGTADSSSLFAYHHLVGRVEVSSVVNKHLQEFAGLIHERVKAGA